ncbi:MAG: TlpA disulfide reductase family protein [Nitrospinota bacterium]
MRRGFRPGGFRRLFRLVLASGLLLLPSFGGVPASTASGARKAGIARSAPDFALPTLEGTRLRLKDFRGKVVLLNFWATWCAPCKFEMPAMEALYGEFKGPDFEILAVSIDARGKEVVVPFVDEMKLTFPILLDREMAAMRRFGVHGLPTTYLIDREGRIAQVAVGPRAWDGEEERSRIRGLIEKGRTR